MDNRVYVVSHKECSLPQIEGYSPLAVGSKGKAFPATYYRDDAGTNISELNNSYCELTGLYWMWKNTAHSHLGLVHYRRYFVDIKNTFMFKGRYIFLNKKNKYHILGIDELEKLLAVADLLVKESDTKKINNETLISTFLGQEIWDELKQTIYDNHKDYIDAFEILSNKKNHINCNMFYGKKEVIDRYCEWLFTVLKQVDDLHISKTGTRYQNREMGYLAELLFGVWIQKNNISIKVVPVVNTGDSYAMDGCLNIFEFLRFMIIKPINHIFGVNIK